MQKYKTWEDLDKINGLVRVTSHTNPYKEDTEEYIMIEYVCSLNGQMLLEKNQQSNSLEILKLYKGFNQDY